MISNKMLTCSATLYKSNGVDEDRNPSYADAVNLSKVYVSEVLGVSNSGNGAQPDDSLTLYYDVFNSLPKGVIFNKGDKIVFDNNSFIINTIRPCYSNGLQHYEIGLI